jgi:NADH-quinone oxidoreductase subunit G
MGLVLMNSRSVDAAFKTLKDSRADTLIILENDLYHRADANIVNQVLDHVKNIIVIDHLINPTSSKADVTLPAATFAEAHGTLVNNEGRAQRFYQVFAPNHDIQASWKWINDIMRVVGKAPLTQPSPLGEEDKRSWDDIVERMASSLPVFKPVRDIAPPSDFRISGQKMPRQPHRYSGRTSMLANENVHESKPQEDADSPLSFSMEGYEGQPPALLISRYWSPGWNSVQALNKYQEEIGGELKDDDAGIKLLDNTDHKEAVFFTSVPGRAKQTDGAPHYNIFSSEELSAYSPAIAARLQTKPPTGSK